GDSQHHCATWHLHGVAHRAPVDRPGVRLDLRHGDVLDRIADRSARKCDATALSPHGIASDDHTRRHEALELDLVADFPRTLDSRPFRAALARELSENARRLAAANDRRATPRRNAQ